MSNQSNLVVLPRHSPRLRGYAENSDKNAVLGGNTHLPQNGSFEAVQAVRVPLTKGLFALVDSADLDLVAGFSWHAKSKRSQPGRYYAQTTERTPTGKPVTFTLHRLLLDAKPGEVVDHLNGDGLDNRRANLRLCTSRENSSNVVFSKRQKLGGFKGVTWNKAANKWQASCCSGEIKSNGKRRQVYLGVFTDPAEAARAYDRAALAAFGPFAALNFSDPEAEAFAMAMGEAAERGAVTQELAHGARALGGGS